MSPVSGPNAPRDPSRREALRAGLSGLLLGVALPPYPSPESPTIAAVSMLRVSAKDPIARWIEAVLIERTEPGRGFEPVPDCAEVLIDTSTLRGTARCLLADDADVHYAMTWRRGFEATPPTARLYGPPRDPSGPDIAPPAPRAEVGRALQAILRDPYAYATARNGFAMVEYDGRIRLRLAPETPHAYRGLLPPALLV